MNPKFYAPIQGFLDVLMEVPGWPDAPLSRRLRRLIPIAIPLVVLGLLAAWTYGYQLPQHASAAAAAQELLSLEAEVSQLGLRCSDSESKRIRDEAHQAHTRLIANAEQRQALFKELGDNAQAAGWKLQITEGETQPSTTEKPPFLRQYCRAQLTPLSTNRRPLASLIPLLEQFSSASKRIDLIRTAIRADEQGWQGVEVAFYACLLPSHEKVAQ